MYICEAEQHTNFRFLGIDGATLGVVFFIMLAMYARDQIML